MKLLTRGRIVTIVALGIEGLLLLGIVDPAGIGNEEDAVWMWLGGLMAFPLAAALVLAHRPDNRVGWALGLVAVSSGLIVFMSWYAVRLSDAPLSSVVESLERLPAVGQFTGIVALLYVFPTGRCITRWHSWTLRLFLVLISAAAIFWVIGTSELDLTGRSNPLHLLPELFGDLGQTAIILLPPFALNGIWSLVLRWRRASGIERSQLKVFLLGALFALVTMAIGIMAPGDEDDADAMLIISGIVGLAAFWSLPTSITVAILRYRLYDIDRIINRTLVYGLLTALLAAIYFGLVVGLQAATKPLAGSSDLAIALTTLIVAALFLPARQRVQALVDRRFNRRAYDAAQTLDAFSARLRQNIDLDTLRYELLAVVDETMEPRHVSLWLRPTEALR